MNMHFWRCLEKCFFFPLLFVWLVVGLAAATFSDAAHHARGMFISSFLFLMVGIGAARTALRQEIMLSIAGKKEKWCGPYLRWFAIIIALAAGCAYILLAVRWVRVLLEASDWSTEVAPGYVVLWGGFVVILALNLWRWASTREPSSTE